MIWNNFMSNEKVQDETNDSLRLQSEELSFLFFFIL